MAVTRTTFATFVCTLTYILLTASLFVSFCLCPLTVASNDELQNSTLGGGKISTSTTKSEESNTINSLLDDLQAETGVGVSVNTVKSGGEEVVDAVQAAVDAVAPDSATKAVEIAEAMEIEDSSSNEVEMTDLSASELTAGKKVSNDVDAVSSTVPSTEPKAAVVEPVKTTITESVDVPDSKVEKSDTPSAAQSTTGTENKVNAVVDEKPKPESTEKEVTIDAKYQDVEKNISSLFNGDDCSPDKQSPTKSIAVAADNKPVPSDGNRSLNNGTNADGTKTSDESAKELVSILEDDKVSAKDGETTTDGAKPTIENKVLSNIKNGSSSSSTPIPTTVQNVFNSTPIQKQFEISSENVSTITVATDGDKSLREPPSADTSAINKSLDVSSTGTGKSMVHSHQPPPLYAMCV